MAREYAIQQGISIDDEGGTTADMARFIRAVRAGEKPTLTTAMQANVPRHLLRSLVRWYGRMFKYPENVRARRALAAVRDEQELADKPRLRATRQALAAARGA